LPEQYVQVVAATVADFRQQLTRRYLMSCTADYNRSYNDRMLIPVGRYCLVPYLRVYWKDSSPIVRYSLRRDAAALHWNACRSSLLMMSIWHRDIADIVDLLSPSVRGLLYLCWHVTVMMYERIQLYQALTLLTGTWWAYPF